MNAEDLFLKKYGNKITASESWVIRFAEEYADQETERLKAELNEVKKQYSELCDVQKKLCEQNISLDSELTELKERHKKDVEMAYGDGKESIFSSNPEEAFMTNEQYYRQKFEK